MRISDWSSDVCSSDLGGDQTLRHDATARSGPHHDIVECVRHRSFPHIIQAYPCTTSPATRTRGPRRLRHTWCLPDRPNRGRQDKPRSEGQTYEIQSLMRHKNAVLPLKTNTKNKHIITQAHHKT